MSACSATSEVQDIDTQTARNQFRKRFLDETAKCLRGAQASYVLVAVSRRTTEDAVDAAELINLVVYEMAIATLMSSGHHPSLEVAP